MANVFDQFDQAPAASARAGGNVFDQFDEGAAAPSAAAPPAGANDWMQAYKVPGVPGISDIVKGLYNAVVGGATLPRDVYEGKVDPKSDEALARSWDLAGLATPMAPAKLAAQAERSALFADPRSTASRAAADAAPVAEGAAKAAQPSAAEVAQAAENVGIPIPRVALAPGYVQKLGAGLSDLPIVGSPLQRSAEQSLTRAQERVGDIASSIGTVSRETAGAGLQEGISDFKTAGIKALQDKAYAPVNEAIPEAAQFTPVNTALALVDIHKRLANSGGELSGEAARVSELAKRGQLDFQAIQDVRSALGKEMKDPLNRGGYDDFASSSLYGALSRDLEDATRAVGGDDLASQWRAANATSKEANQQFKDVKSLANPTTSPNSAFEQVYGLAMDRRGNLDKLYQVKKTVSPEDWANISATALDRMGKNANEQFSMQVFASSYDKMSPSARSILFGESAKAVDDLATSFKALQGIERFKSKSQSANPTALLGMGAGASAAAMTHPVSTAVGGAIAFITANQMAKPATVKQIASLTKTYDILVRRPSAGIARQADQQTNRLGVMLIQDGAAPAAANDITRSFIDATRSVVGPPRGAAASGELQEQNQQ